MLRTPKTIASKVVYKNPWLVVREDKIIHANGKPGIYGLVESLHDGVYIVPVDNEGNTYLVKQYRYTEKREVWECIAGRMNTGEADPLITAKRELFEESGLEAGTFHHLTDLRVANGMTTFICPVFLARDIEKTSDELDQEDGILACKKIPLDTVMEMIMKKEIVCSQSIAAFMIANKFLKDKGI